MRKPNLPYLSLCLCLATIGGLARAQSVPPRGNVAIGTSAGSPVTGEFNTAVGTSSGQVVSGNNNVAIGLSAGQLVSGDDTITIGTSAGQGTTASQAIAIGLSSRVAADGAIAVGAGADAAGRNSIVFGAGSSDGGQANVVSIGNTGNERRIINLQAGSLAAGSTDAVNGGQLFMTNQTVAAAQASADRAASAAILAQSNADRANNGLAQTAASLGGGASYDGSTGAYQAPSFTVMGTSYGDVASALMALDNGIASSDALSVLYDDARHGSLTLGGAGAPPVALSNLAPGMISANSSNAVTGAQLFATNQVVAQNAAAIANTAAATAALGAAIDQGTIGLVQQAGGNPAGAITIGATTGGASLSVAGTGGPRTVSGVAAGSVAQGSTDAVNGGQVFALSQQLGVGLGAMTKRLDALDTRIAQLGFDLRKFRRDANSGIATAVALGALPQATNPGRWAVGMGTGLRDGQLAIAAGASWRSPNDVFVVNLRAGYDEASFTAGAGFGMEF